ncbi:MAG TPA: SCO family protein [Caulobacteraceae bacterium]|nr:SCO family protein [Caulobacteraceae bacterium]
MFSRRIFSFAAATLALSACSPGQEAPKAAIGGPFTLVDQNGKPQTQAVLNGKWSAVFFGYTYCPDICPATLQALAEAERQLKPKGKDFQVVFISVDPARDTPAQMKTYLDNQAFPGNAVGLTGSDAQVAAAAKAYKVYYQKEGSGADYTVGHVAYTYLMDPKGQFVRIIGTGDTPDDIAYEISQAMAGNPDARPAKNSAAAPKS